jgi:hypothetical protein
MIIRQFDPDEYSRNLPTVPTEELVELLQNEGHLLEDREEKQLIRYELMYSLLKRELSLRGAL